MSAAEQEVSTLELEYEHYFSMADEMLRAINRENRPASFAERTFFTGRCGWDDAEQSRQIRRMYGVMRNLAIVGTESDREAAYDERTKSSEVLASEKPKLQKKLEAIQEQISSLERAATSAERRCEQIDTALSEITKLENLRPDLIAKHNGLMVDFGNSEWSVIGALRIEIEFREQLLVMQPGDALIGHLRIAYPDCAQRREHRLGEWEIVGDAWQNRKAILRQELSEMKPEYERLQQLKSQQMAELEEIRSHYLKEQK